MKNIITFILLSFCFSIIGQNPFEVELAQNAEELEAVVFDLNFQEVLKENSEIFGKNAGFEQTKLQYLFRALQDNNIQNYLFQEILELKKCCDVVEPVDPNAELFILTAGQKVFELMMLNGKVRNYNSTYTLTNERVNFSGDIEGILEKAISNDFYMGDIRVLADKFEGATLIKKKVQLPRIRLSKN